MREQMPEEKKDNQQESPVDESLSESERGAGGKAGIPGKTAPGRTGATEAEATKTNAARTDTTEAQAHIEASAEAGLNGLVEMASLPDFSGMLADAAASSIDLLNDVELNVKIELGRSEMTVNEILHLGNGSVVELDKLAGDPVDVLVNEQLIARGEVLVVNDSFCVRINEIVPGISERVAGVTKKK
jgi:flagellar motor switch protein FliN/FliY